MFRYVMMLLASTALTPIAMAATPVPVGKGCTTTFFIDKDCDGRGVGKKSSGLYPLGQNSTTGGSFQPGTYTMGDTPDADDDDPTVGTTAEWQAKWGVNNQAIVNFLQQRKGFTNTSRIFYLSQNGNDATAVMNDPTHPWRNSTTIITKMLDLKGGTIIVRGGTWDKELYLGGGCYTDPAGKIWCMSLSGSPGNPAYVMNYPGELVVTNRYAGFVGYTCSRKCGYLTIDGLAFRSDVYGSGDGISASFSTDFSVINSEFAGWHQIAWGNGSRNALVQGNVFHDMHLHTVYFLSSGDPVSWTPNGDFDFAADALKANPRASFNGQVLDNVMYNSGVGGYEPIHINTFTTGVKVNGNIVTYSGGTCLTLQSGVSFSEVKNNVCFNNGKAGMTINNYGPDAVNIHDNVIENNTFWGGTHLDAIRGTYPTYGIISFATANADKKMYNMTIRNNIIVVDTYGTQPYVPAPLLFGKNSYPDTYIIENNLFWSSAARAPLPTDRMMEITADAQGHASGNFTFAQFQNYSPAFANNLYANPKFVAAAQAYTLTPELFNLRPQAGSPAIGAGSAVGAPALDIMGVTRGSPPSIGAYDVAGLPAPLPPPLAPEITVLGSGNNIVDGSTTPTGASGTDFGTVSAGDPPVSHAFTVRNDGTANLTTSGLTVPAGYTIVEGLSATIAPGALDTFTVQLDTALVGAKTGDVSFVNSDGDENPFNFQVTATVNVPPAPEVVVSSSGNNIVDGSATPSGDNGTGFGTPAVGDPPVSHVFEVRNVGTAALTTSGLTVPSGYTIAEDLSASIAPGAADTFAVQLDTSVPGVKSGDIGFVSNDGNESPFTFTVTGEVAAPVVLPPPTPEHCDAQDVVRKLLSLQAALALCAAK